MLSRFDWLVLNTFEMELIDFQECAVWKTKFINLNLKLLEKEVKPLAYVTKENEPLESNAVKLLAEWQSLLNSFASMKKMTLAMLTIFGGSSSCETFLSMIYVKSTTRNCLRMDTTAECVKLKTTKYEPQIKILETKIQQQVSHLKNKISVSI